MTDPNMPGVLTDLGSIQADTKRVAYEVVAAAAAAGHPLYFVWGAGATGDHKKGIAIDFMVYDRGEGVAKPGRERPDVGTWIARYVWEHRARLGVRYEIYNRRIRSTTGNPPDVWLDYHATPDPHTNHVHVSRLADAPEYRAADQSTPTEITGPGSGTIVFWRQIRWQTENPERIVYRDQMMALKTAITALRSPALPPASTLDVTTPRPGPHFREAIRWVQETVLHDIPDAGPFPFLGPSQLAAFCKLPAASPFVRFGGPGDLHQTTSAAVEA